MPKHGTCGIFIPDNRSSPEPLEWEHWLQDPRTPENSPQGVSNSENSHKGNHLNTRPGITQPPVAPCAGRLIKTTKKTKIRSQSLSDKNTTLLSHAHQSKNKQPNKISAQISPYTKLTQTTGPTLGGQKPKGRKNSTFFKERLDVPWSLRKGDLKHNNL